MLQNLFKMLTIKNTRRKSIPAWKTNNVSDSNVLDTSNYQYDGNKNNLFYVRNKLDTEFNRPTLKKNNDSRNISEKNGCSFVVQITPLLFLLRYSGIMPITKTPTGWTFSVFSFNFLYCVCIYTAMMPIYLTVFMEDMVYLSDESANGAEFLNTKLYYELLSAAILPFCISPISSWCDGPDTARYLNSWNEFQVLFFNVTKTHLTCSKWKVFGCVVCVILLGVSAVLAIHYFPPELPYWKCSTSFFSVLSVSLGFAMWYITANTLGKAGELLASHFKQEVMNNNCSVDMLCQYRKLWLSLSELTTLTGMAAWRSYILPMSLSLWFITLSLYGFVASISDFNTPMYLKILYALSTICYIIPITLICDQAHWIPIKVRNSILVELQKLNTYNIADVNTWREVIAFQQTIHMNPSVIDLGGFVIVDRQLLQSIGATVVTYLIVILQFRVGLEAEDDPNIQGFNETITV